MSEQLSMDWNQVETCEIFCSDEQKVRRLRECVGQAEGLGNLFKAFSDETRAKILYCLLREELCVCDVSQILGMSVQAVSHHLRLLATMRIVKSRRDGKMIFYSLDDEHIAALIHNGLAHVHEERR
ncbi:MAG TPA: metalloregulator ArsR/SmtB family transcription factor [Armatimonadota bacterium]|jgi:DNA-binding transcriptional ArsR family regulator